MASADAEADGAGSGTDSIPGVEAPLKYAVRRCAAGNDGDTASDGCSFCSCSASNSSRAGGETDALMSLAEAANVWLLPIDWGTTDEAASSASPSRIAAEAFRADARWSAEQREEQRAKEMNVLKRKTIKNCKDYAEFHSKSGAQPMRN